MARKPSIRVSLDPDQLDHAEWYLKTFDNCNTLQDVIRMFLDQYPDALIQRVAQQKESIRLQMMEVAEVLHVPAHHSEIMRLTRQNIEQINQLQEQVKHLRAEEKRLNKELEKKNDSLANYRTLMGRAHVAAGSKEGVPFGEVIDDIITLRSKYEAILDFLSPLEHIVVAASDQGEDVAIYAIRDILEQKRKLRNEINDIAKYFECAQNGNAILYEAKERLRVIASKLGVPDTMEHIVERIVELNKSHLGKQTEINENVQQALNMVGAALDMPRDGMPINAETILHVIEYNRKDIKQKAQALDKGRYFVSQVRNAIGIDDRECIDFDEIADKLRNRLQAYGRFSEQIRNALQFDNPEVRTHETVVGELNHQLFLKGEREKESKYFQRMLYQPLHKLIWFRINRFLFQRKVGKEINNGTESEG